MDPRIHPEKTGNDNETLKSSIFELIGEGVSKTSTPNSSFLEKFEVSATDKIDNLLKIFINKDRLSPYSAPIRRTLGLTAMAVALAAFACLFYFTYDTTRNAYFISLDPNSGSCEEVPKSITGTYGIDFLGYWQGNTLFNPSRARYIISLNNYQHDGSEYVNLMKTFKSVINSIGYASKSRVLTDNLLYWMSWSRISTDNNKILRLQFSGSIISVFDRFSIQASLTTPTLNCNAIPLCSYNSLSGELSIDYSYNEYSSACSNISPAQNLGYIPNTNGDQFRLKLDMRSVMTALAVNKGIFKYENLVDIHLPMTEIFTYHSITYKMTNKIDDRYTGMTPIRCFENITEVPSNSLQPSILCTVKIAAVYGYPFFIHKGLAGKTLSNGVKISQYTPYPCNCTSSSGKETQCNTFDLMAGIIFTNPVSNATVQFRNMMKMISTSGAKNVENVAFIAAFSALTMGNGKVSGLGQNNMPPSDYLALKTLANSTKSFLSKSVLKDAKILAVNFYEPFAVTVNENFLSLDGGSCSDTFSMSDESWSLIADSSNPPSSLVETYYKCLPGEQQALISAYGITMGVLSSLLLPIAILIIALAKIIKIKRTTEIPILYDDITRNKVLQEYATYLLLVRDQHVQDVSHDTIVEQIVATLKKHSSNNNHAVAVAASNENELPMKS
eukprot:gene7968-16311_t